MLTSNDNVIRENPLLETSRNLFTIWCVILPLYGAVLILLTIGLIFESSNRLTDFMHWLFYALLFLMYVFLFASTRLQRRYWKRIEQRRFAAAQGDRSLLAAQQPTMDVMTLQLPFTISLRYNKESIPSFIGIALLFALYIAGTFVLLNDDFLFVSHNRFYTFLVLFACAFALIVIILLAIVFSSSARQEVTVTEQGLSTLYARQKAAVKWEEARLFAMYPTKGAQKSGASITYELSSVTAIARWVWVQPRSRGWRMSLVPTVPFDEYQREMEALNTLIVTRTGLPLSDLGTKAVADLPRDPVLSTARRER